jgi:amino acid adenylation domain-containing protein/thioester reductase-like protein
VSRFYGESVGDGDLASSREPVVQYAELAARQRRWLEGEGARGELDYWKRQLADVATTELRSDRARPAVQTFSGAVQSLRVAPSIAGALESLARGEDATPLAVWLALSASLLRRHTGVDDTTVGTPVAGRDWPDAERTIGPCESALALRLDVASGITFRELIRHARDVCREADENRRLPFEKVVEELQPDRDLSRSPLFQIMLAVREPAPPVRLPGLSIERVDVDADATRFDLTLEVVVEEEGVHGALLYNPDLFDRQSIVRLAGHLEMLVRGAVADPDRPIADLPVLSAAELHQILVEWNETGAPSPAESTVQAMFEARAAERPSAIAVRCDGAQLSYGELNQRANRLAHALRERGVKGGERVAIYMKRSLDVVVGILGVLKAAGAYVPLDASYPSERIRFILGDARPKVVLTHERLAADVTGVAADVLLLDRDWPRIEHASAADPFVRSTPEAPAYLIYTSGSTGEPKGVVVTQANLIHSTAARLRFYREPVSSFLLLSSFAFDSSVAGIFWTLCQGGTLRLAPEDFQYDASGLVRIVEEEGVSHLLCVPSLYAHLLAEAEPERLASLRTVVVAGETCPWPLVEKHRQALPKAGLFNEYGPTEATVWATVYDCLTARAGSSVPIGRPIANARIYILDPHGRPVPIGVAGELQVGGRGVAQGYFDRPALTDEKFVPDPFRGEPGARLYKTGDLGRWLEDGNVEFLGRIDQQVKIRGYRVELSEIESVLRAQPTVHDAAVLLREDVPGAKRLVAYVVAERGAATAAPELRRFVQERLPEYMVPSVFLVEAALPLSPNGKIDRKALPAPDPSRQDLAEAYVAPRTPVESDIASLWCQILGVDRVGVNDDFFELGGHSLLVAELFARLRDRYPVEVPVRVLFETPTVAGLADAIDVVRRAGLSGAVVDATDLAAEAVLDLEICPELPPLEPVTEPQHVFLTGATGFLGAFLLHDLLRQTGATVHCLVRAPRPEEAMGRLEKKLRSYLLWDEAFRGRVVPIVGDLGKPLFGLSPAQFRLLGRTIDAIYHCGAVVNFIYPYSVLKPANVRGTLDVLRLATLTKVKPLHHVSALDVFATIEPPGEGDWIIREEDDPQPYRIFTGYGQSKWVSERLVMKARDRGLPVRIYRPGLITGHSASGACNTNDVGYRMLKGCIQLGCIPDLDMKVSMIPADFVSSSILYLSQQKESLGQVFHIVNPRPVHLSEFVGWIRSFGYPLEQLPYREWRERLIRATERSRENVLYPLLPFFAESIPPEATMQFRCENMLRALSESGIVCPPLSAKLLGTYFSYLIDIDFLIPPAGFHAGQRPAASEARAETTP